VTVAWAAVIRTVIGGSLSGVHSFRAVYAAIDPNGSDRKRGKWREDWGKLASPGCWAQCMA
jgi:hypothetical protein